MPHMARAPCLSSDPRPGWRRNQLAGI